MPTSVSHEREEPDLVVPFAALTDLVLHSPTESAATAALDVLVHIAEVRELLSIDGVPACFDDPIQERKPLCLQTLVDAGANADAVDPTRLAMIKESG